MKNILADASRKLQALAGTNSGTIGQNGPPSVNAAIGRKDRKGNGFHWTVPGPDNGTRPAHGADSNTISQFAKSANDPRFHWANRVVGITRRAVNYDDCPHRRDNFGDSDTHDWLTNIPPGTLRCRRLDRPVLSKDTRRPPQQLRIDATIFASVPALRTVTYIRRILCAWRVIRRESPGSRRDRIQRSHRRDRLTIFEKCRRHVSGHMHSGHGGRDSPPCGMTPCISKINTRRLSETRPITSVRKRLHAPLE